MNSKILKSYRYNKKHENMSILTGFLIGLVFLITGLFMDAEMLIFMGVFVGITVPFLLWLSYYYHFILIKYDDLLVIKASLFSPIIEITISNITQTNFDGKIIEIIKDDGNKIHLYLMWFNEDEREELKQYFESFNKNDAIESS
jgi:hypothetical protein